MVTRWGGRRSLTATLFTLGTVPPILLPLTALALIAVREALNAAGLISETLASSGIGGSLRSCPTRSPAGRISPEILPGQIQKLQSQIGAGGRWALATVSGTVA